MKRLAMAAMAACLLLVCNLTWAQAKNIGELPWVAGPATGQIGGNATIKVPEGYAFLGPDGAREFNRLTENPDTGIDEYVLAKDDLSWIAFFSFDPVGYVKDDEKLDADDLLQSVTEGTEASNEERKRNGWDSVHVTGWAFKPQYDSGIKSLEWAFRLKGEQSEGESINYNTRLLGRRGVMQVLLLTDQEHLQASVADFKSKLPGFSFNSGESYADFRDGDHVAEYGLAALVTGGAAAVAAKKGVFAAIGIFLLKMWKLLVVAVVGGFAAIRKLFGGKDKDAQP
ncbi:MAG: DUF2167 domain-containing protein [Thermomonas sp.]|uniref:DUF2167 domain-containing protein n=1 Tax=Thermomonas sp. TaxID=1971895 RepID=UPI0039E674E8